jgi:hypothetical protein
MIRNYEVTGTIETPFSLTLQGASEADVECKAHTMLEKDGNRVTVDDVLEIDE